MNILFFLTPKSEVAYISEEDTLRQALEKMEYHKYSAIPIISRTGRYIGTLTEGDLLWGIKRCGEDPHYSHQAQTGQPSGKGRRRYGRPDRKSVKPEFCACIR